MNKLSEVREPIRRQWLGATIRPLNFVKWAEKHYIEFPKELAELIHALDPYKKEPIASNIVKTQDKPLGNRERETLLKLIIGMAVSGYSYNPGATRNAAISEIASDLEGLGISLSDDTIRNKLEEAKELLPREAQKI